MVDAPEVHMPEVCGTCRWGRRVDPDTVECHNGCSVTCLPVATGKNIVGQDVMDIRFFFPRYPAKEPRCAVYAFGEQIQFIKPRAHVMHPAKGEA